jgi:hypothetical protein
MTSAPGPDFVKHLIVPEPIRVEHFTVLTKAYYTILKKLAEGIHPSLFFPRRRASTQGGKSHGTILA